MNTLGDGVRKLEIQNNFFSSYLKAYTRSKALTQQLKVTWGWQLGMSTMLLVRTVTDKDNNLEKYPQNYRIFQSNNDK